MKVGTWNDTSFVAAGDEVVALDERWKRKTGDKIVGHGHGDDIPWLVVGALGRVVEVKEGYPRHRCPGRVHGMDEDGCYCGGDEWIPESSAWAKVEWQMTDGSVWTGRAIFADGEGETWRRAEDSKSSDGISQ